MIYETKESIILAARAHKISVHTAVQLLKQLKEVKKIKEEVIEIAKAA